MVLEKMKSNMQKKAANDASIRQNEKEIEERKDTIARVKQAMEKNEQLLLVLEARKAKVISDRRTIDAEIEKCQKISDCLDVLLSI